MFPFYLKMGEYYCYQKYNEKNAIRNCHCNNYYYELNKNTKSITTIENNSTKSWKNKAQLITKINSFFKKISDKFKY